MMKLIRLATTCFLSSAIITRSMSQLRIMRPPKKSEHTTPQRHGFAPPTRVVILDSRTIRNAVPPTQNRVTVRMKIFSATRICAS